MFSLISTFESRYCPNPASLSEQAVKDYQNRAKASRLGTNLIACDVAGKLENNVNGHTGDLVEYIRGFGEMR